MVYPIDDIEFLARSVHRVETLEILADGPRDRAELQTATGASSSTIGRVLGNFETRHWVVRNGRRYELTQLGAFVAERFTKLVEDMTIERKLRDVWQWLPTELPGFDIELFTDATVSVSEPNAPYRPVSRFIDIVEAGETLRGIATVPLEPVGRNALLQNVVDGMETMLVLTPSVADDILRSDPERATEAIESGGLTLQLLDDPPEMWGGLCVTDTYAALCCCDRRTGLFRVHVDTDALEAREWVTSVYESVRRKARPLDTEAVVA